MKDIIESLYYGDLCPAVHNINKYHLEKTEKEVREKEEQFLKSIGDFDMNLYDEYMISLHKSSRECAINDFKQGFILGSRLALSVAETKLDYDE
ncbi:MAG: hypothetical protein FWG33_00315 [Oscillospiraceae bacterium]|nr:hypothetical protein [Oscillospiraceae bacterium]